jgi:CubicO group peptidase (beta-lactamase class C family)
VVNRRDGFESLGTYGWDGGMGTSWRNDPKRDLTGVFLTQVTWSAPIPPAVQRDFWTLTYAALEG